MVLSAKGGRMVVDRASGLSASCTLCALLIKGICSSLPDILTQRPFRVDHNVAVLKMDIDHMVAGQKAGLCFLGRTYGSIDVVRDSWKHVLRIRKQWPDYGRPTTGHQPQDSVA